MNNVELPIENRDDRRLQVVLAHAGVASRRHCAEMIRAGRVEVDGKIVREPGFRIEGAKARLCVDGRTLRTQAPAHHRTIMLHKPKGLVCAVEDRFERTVFECLRGIPERIVPVGRLDKESEGLLLLSSDGDFVNALTHPRYGQRKEYHVTVRGTLTRQILAELRSGMVLEDDGTALCPVDVEVLDEDPDTPTRFLLRMVLHEGRNRQIRRMCEQVGLRVERLVRTAIRNLRLPRDLKPGEWRDLTATELGKLNF